MKRLIFCSAFILIITILPAQRNFSFVYLPDLHLRPDSAVTASFERTVKQINKLHPDFVLTGGDMIYTAKTVDDKKAGVLFDFMDKEFRLFKMPVYYTIGNHEHVGIDGNTGIYMSNPNWGKQMWIKRYGKQYYTFNYNGWKFFILDGIRILPDQKGYTEGIDSLQINWIKSELSITDKKMPVVISIHPPIVNPHNVTTSTRVMSPQTEAVLNLFRDYNLKSVLEGHTHYYMDLYYHGTYYLSGGSSSYGTDDQDDGFFILRVRNGNVEPEFIKTDRLKTLNRNSVFQASH
jgi:UDP-2,3-diacylglucosamine pyrophosphatase LpxH